MASKKKKTSPKAEQNKAVTFRAESEDGDVGPAKTGRKLIDIDPKVVEGMAFAGAPTTDIADFLGVGEATIRRRFGDILTKSHARRRTRLRELQWRAAESGNTAMLIWLGKQYLGQAEKTEAVSPYDAREVLDAARKMDEVTAPGVAA